MSKNNFTIGPVGISLYPSIDQTGKPYIEACFANMPEGVEIVGNGTSSHPFAVKLSGAYLAAPELLEACRKMLFWMETPETAEHAGMSWRDCLPIARAAIAKAEGK